MGPKLKLRLHASVPQRVNFYENDGVDEKVMVGVMLGWRLDAIARISGLTVSQVGYRIYTKLGASVRAYRGASDFSLEVFNRIRVANVTRQHKREMLEAADITPEMDKRDKKVLV